MGTFKGPWSSPIIQEGLARPHVPAPQARCLPWCPQGKGGSQELWRVLQGGTEWVVRRGRQPPGTLGLPVCRPHSSMAPPARKTWDLSAHIHSYGGDPG